MQRECFFFLGKFWQAGKHVLDRIHAGGCTTAARSPVSAESLHSCGAIIPFRKLRISFTKLFEIVNNFPKQIFHVHMSIGSPNLVGFSNFDLIRLFILLTSIDYIFVCDLVAVFDVEEIQRHSLVGKFVYQGRHEIHRTI